MCIGLGGYFSTPNGCFAAREIVPPVCCSPHLPKSPTRARHVRPTTLRLGPRRVASPFLLYLDADPLPRRWIDSPLLDPSVLSFVHQKECGERLGIIVSEVHVVDTRRVEGENIKREDGIRPLVTSTPLEVLIPADDKHWEKDDEVAGLKKTTPPLPCCRLKGGGREGCDSHADAAVSHVQGAQGGPPAGAESATTAPATA